MPGIGAGPAPMDLPENHATRAGRPITVAAPHSVCGSESPYAASGNGDQLPHNRSGSWMKNPDRGLGSNHVDFGGITCPASATATSSSMPVG